MKGIMKNNKSKQNVAPVKKAKNAALEWVEDYDVVSTWAKKYNLPKLLKKGNGIAHVKNFFPPHVADGALKMIESFDEKEWISTDAKRDPKKNNVSHSFKSIKQNKQVQKFARCFDLLKEDMLPSFQVARYLQSDHIEPHDDKQYTMFQMEDGQNVECSRRIAVIVYLTKDWSASLGGCLKDLVGGTTIVPEFNSAVFFEVPRMHEVTPMLAKNRPRYSFFGWFYTPGRAYQLDDKKAAAAAAAAALEEGEESDSSLELEDSEPADSEDEVEVDLDGGDSEDDEDGSDDEEGEADLAALLGQLARQVKSKNKKQAAAAASDDDEDEDGSDLDLEGMDMDLNGSDDEDGEDDGDASDSSSTYSWDEEGMEALLAQIAAKTEGMSDSDGEDEDGEDEEDDSEDDEPAAKRQRLALGADNDNDEESDNEDEDGSDEEDDEDGSSESELEYEEFVDENGETHFPPPKTEKGRQQLQARVESMLFEGAMKAMAEAKMRQAAAAQAGDDKAGKFSLLKSLIAQDPSILARFTQQLEDAGDSSGEEWTPENAEELQNMSDDSGSEDDSEDGSDASGSDDDEDGGELELTAAAVPVLLEQMAQDVESDSDNEDEESSDDDEEEEEVEDAADESDEDVDEDAEAQRKVLSLIATTVNAPSAAYARAAGASPALQKLVTQLRTAQAARLELDAEISAIAAQVVRKGGVSLILPAELLQEEDGEDDGEGADVNVNTSDEEEDEEEESSEDDEE